MTLRSKNSLPENIHILQDIFSRSHTMRTPVAVCKTMLIPQEQNLLRLLARCYFTDEGAIFDGGCCLGGCAQSFAYGLAERTTPPATKVLHTYEWAICYLEYVQTFIHNAHQQTLNIGDSFAHLVEHNLSHCIGSEYIHLHIGDILQQEYPEKIEILFLDVCKTVEINHAMQLLFARLIPGKSVVIHQDYVHEFLPWIKVTMGYFKEYFEPIGSVGPSFVFLYTKQIPHTVLHKNLWSTLDITEKLDCFTRYYDFLNVHEQLILDIGKAVLLDLHGEFDKAYSVLKITEIKNQTLNNNLVTDILQNIQSIFASYPQNKAKIPPTSVSPHSVINALKDKTKQLEHEVYALRNSKSWKITAPLRWLLGIFVK